MKDYSKMSDAEFEKEIDESEKRMDELVRLNDELKQRSLDHAAEAISILAEMQRRGY